MQNQHYEYGTILADSLKVNWRVEDIIGGDKKLDFTRPFLPDTLAGVSGLKCLTAEEKLKLNQIRGNSYLYLFGFCEEFILPFVLDQARKGVHGDNVALRALVTFAEEEAKHMHVFKRFAEEFAKGFATECKVIGPAKDVSMMILQNGSLSVALLILHLEWETLRHYVDSAQSDVAIDPQFASLLRHHWMEESQHAKVDTLLVAELAAAAGPEGIEKSLDEYLALGGAFDALLTQQVQLDLESLEKAIGRTLSGAEREEITQAQVKSYRWTFLGSGMTHPNFIRTLGEISPKGQARVAEVAAAFC